VIVEALIISNQPVTHSPDCLIELAFKFDAVHADLHTALNWLTNGNSAPTGSRRVLWLDAHNELCQWRE
jgi:hypothetical protein